jgi:hypothetical protein
MAKILDKKQTFDLQEVVISEIIQRKPLLIYWSGRGLSLKRNYWKKSKTFRHQ